MVSCIITADTGTRLQCFLKILFVVTVVVAESLHTGLAAIDVDAAGNFATGVDPTRAAQVPLIRVEQSDSVEADASSGKGLLEDLSAIFQSLTGYVLKSSETKAAENPLPSKAINLVTLFSVECITYHDWQSVVVHQTWRHSNLPGQLVRLLACEPSRLKNYRRFEELGDGMQTYVHASMSYESGKSYPPLNKPWGILSWLTEGSGRNLQNDTVVLIVDPDMAFKPGDTAESLMPLIQRVQLSGEALGLDYGYVRNGMRHNKWQLPLKFIPKTRLPFLQSIGPPMLIRKDKLAQLAREWHDITLSIEQDRELKSLVHDGSQRAPWIAEMYGYSLAAAKLLPHSHETQVQWPALQAPQPPWAATGAAKGLQTPLILHYSHSFNLCGKQFGKSLYSGLDLLNCSISTEAFDQMLQPPPKEKVMTEGCGLCLGDGDVIGFRSTCLNSSGKSVSLDAWSQVYHSLVSWRQERCPRSP